MKILIIGIGRSGTSSLIHGISKQNYFEISEPYNSALIKQKYPLRDLERHSDIVVKTLSHQKPRKYHGSWYNFILEFSKNFDKIIMLDRLDFDEHYESMINLWWQVKNNQDIMAPWSSEEIPELFRTGYELGGGKMRLHAEKTDFNQLAEKLKCKITWYEELYGNDRQKSLHIIKEWKLNINEHLLNDYLNPKYKIKKKC